jgi:Flp pilus assembly protein TadG
VKQLRSMPTLFDEQSSSLVELALVMPMLVFLMVGAIEFGQAYYVSIEVTSAAEAGASYGVINLTDTAGMASAAILDAADVPAMTASATWGCECSDGSNATVNCTSVPACSANLVDYVDVNTSVTFQPMLTYPGMPSNLALKGHSRMRVAP